MTKYLIIVLTIILDSLSPAQEFTLEESIELGLKNSKDLAIYNSKLISADAKITEAGSQMLPKLTFSAGYSRLSEIPPFEILTPFFSNPIRLYDVLLNNYNLKLSFQQPLFTGFRLSSFKNSAELNYKATETENDEVKNKVAFEIQNAFWNYYKAEQIRELIKENLEQIGLHLEDTRNFLENGLVTRNDLLKLEVQYSNTELILIDAENNLQLSKIIFNKAIGIDLNSPSIIKAKTINLSQYDYDLDEIIREAKNNRKDLESLGYKIKMGEENITSAKAGWYPSIFLFGNFYYSRPNLRILPPQDKFKDTWDIGISLNWDLWNWGYTSAQTIQAEENKIQSEISLNKLTDAVEIEVTQSYLNYKKSLDRIAVIQKSVDQADENYRITKEKYNSQLSTSSDLIDAEVSSLQAKTNLTNALTDYEISRLMLEKVIGRKIY